MAQNARRDNTAQEYAARGTQPGAIQKNNQARQTADKVFVSSQAARTISGAYQENFRTDVVYRKPANEAQYDAANDQNEAVNDNQVSRTVERPGISRAEISRRMRPKNPKKLKAANNNPKLTVRNAKKAAKQAKAVATFISIIGWGTALYIIQLKLALLSLIAFGIGGVVSQISENVSKVDGDLGLVDAVTGIIVGIGSTIVEAAADAIENLFGIDIPDPYTFVATFLFLPFLVGIATLLIMGIQYVITLHNPMGGKKADMKMMAVIVALVGYFLPFLNLFPWALAWALIVLRYPK